MSRESGGFRKNGEGQIIDHHQFTYHEDNLPSRIIVK